MQGYEGPSFKISDEEKIKTAATYKADGNIFYKGKEFRKAIGKYHRAILQLKAVGSEKRCSALMPVPMAQPPELSADMQVLYTSLKSDCYNNLAACLLQQEAPNYSKVLEYCDYVLEDQSNNSKAKYRKGVALYHLQKYEEAQEILVQIEGTDAATKKYLSLCKQAIREQDKNLQKTYRAMFSGNSEQQTKMDET